MHQDLYLARRLPSRIPTASHNMSDTNSDSNFDNEPIAEQRRGFRPKVSAMSYYHSASQNR